MFSTGVHKRAFQLRPATIGWALFLVLSASFMRQVLEGFQTVFGKSLTGPFIWLAFLLFGSFVLREIKQRELQRFTPTIALFVVGLLYAATFDIAEERIHLVKYGILGWLLAGDSARSGLSSGLLIVLVGALFVASVDEIFQYYLPYRVGDPRDVLFGVVGALWAALLYRSLQGSELKEVSQDHFR